MFRLYDTRTQRAETITSARAGLLRMHFCGPAAGRHVHIGDLRARLLADLIRRNAEHRHHLSVQACQTTAGAGHRADDGASEEAFRADCSALNLLPAEHAPFASKRSGPVIDMIARLIKTGHAYPTPDGSVYFDARSFPSYGELSGRRLDGLRSGDLADGDDGAGSQDGSRHRDKRFHADWPLWKSAPAGREPTSAAPWGTGFPGRHAGCSAWSLHHLGDVIDIHAGGIDLCFPHHEDERAQSNSATGREVVRHWAHGGHLQFDGASMATSARNVTLADLADRGLDPLALRLAFLEHRYRQQIDLTWDTVSAADQTLRRWRELVARWACSPSKPVHARAAAEVAAAFDDDLDTPAALRVLRGLEQDQGVAPGSKFESFAHADQLLGLDLARDVGRVAAQP